MKADKKEIESIEPNKWYNLSELSELGRKRLFPFVNRGVIKRYIDAGDLHCVQGESGPTNKPYYRIKGQWILDFLDKYAEEKVD